MKKKDPMVFHPSHYLQHGSGIEVIEVTEHLNFNQGNAVKYILRCEHKGKLIQDLEKAIWYLQREVVRIEKARISENDEATRASLSSSNEEVDYKHLATSSFWDTNTIKSEDL